MSILKVDHLVKHFGGLHVVNDLSFQVNKGEILGLIGTNGAGKTTTFNLISGFIKPTSGQIWFDGNNITNFPPHEISRLGLVRTFQQTSLFFSLSVLENVLYALNGVNHLSINIFDCIFNTRRYKQTVKMQKDKAIELLQRTGLERKQNMIANSLSYGEQRRLSIVVALAASPKLIMLDEPAAGLNPSESSELVKFIRTIADEGISVVIVEHDMKVVMNLCDKIVVMDHGTKIAEGTPSEIRNNKDVIEIYLGSNVGVV